VWSDALALQRNRGICTLRTLRTNHSRLTEASRAGQSLRGSCEPEGSSQVRRTTATAMLTMTIVVGVARAYRTVADWFYNIAFTGRMP